MPRNKSNRQPSRITRSPDFSAKPLSESEILKTKMVEILNDLSLTPIQLLELILKLMLPDKITEEEARLITAVYFQAIKDGYCIA